MQNQRKEPPQAAPGSDDEKTQKARMLISLLGADFTRTATHPARHPSARLSPKWPARPPIPNKPQQPCKTRWNTSIRQLSRVS